MAFTFSPRCTRLQELVPEVMDHRDGTETIFWTLDGRRRPFLLPLMSVCPGPAVRERRDPPTISSLLDRLNSSHQIFIFVPLSLSQCGTLVIVLTESAEVGV